MERVRLQQVRQALPATIILLLAAGQWTACRGAAAAQRDDRGQRSGAAASDADAGGESAGESDHDEQPQRERGRRGSGRRARGWPLFGVPSWQLTDGRDVRNAFQEVVAQASQSMVCIHCDGRHALLGSVVDARGFVLTKASDLHGELTVHHADGEEFPAEVVARDKQHDLALLWAEGLESMSALQLEDVDAPPVGAWLATVGKTAAPVAVGVMSVGPRDIAHQPGVLGVQLGGSPRSRGEEPPIVEQVFADTAAEEAGIQINDLILRVNEQPISTRAELVATVRTFSPGDKVTVEVQRDDEQLEFSVRLGSSFPGIDDRDEMQNMMGGRLSNRRFGFANAFQHDTVLRPIDCGGPVVNLDGQVVGFNVARSGRTESYAIDVKTVRGLLEQWLRSEATELVSTALQESENPPQAESGGDPAPANEAPSTEAELAPAG